jgi:hypothetical protein
MTNAIVVYNACEHLFDLPDKYYDRMLRLADNCLKNDNPAAYVFVRILDLFSFESVNQQFTQIVIIIFAGNDPNALLLFKNHGKESILRSSSDCSGHFRQDV